MNIDILDISICITIKSELWIGVFFPAYIQASQEQIQTILVVIFQIEFLCSALCKLTNFTSKMIYLVNQELAQQRCLCYVADMKEKIQRKYARCCFFFVFF